MTRYESRPGAVSYGHEIGILLVDCRTPFIPGDVGNASTYDFTVLYELMPGVSLERLINGGDLSMVDIVVEHARKLEDAGVRAITSDCGYMLYFQNAVAQQLRIPVMLSSLLQLPFIGSLLGKNQSIGLICANRRRLTGELLGPLLKTVQCPVRIGGMETYSAFRGPILDETPMLDQDAVQAAVLDRADHMLQANPDIGAWLLECSNLPPYAAALQRTTGRPVFDFVTLINHVRAACHRQEFSGVY